MAVFDLQVFLQERLRAFDENMDVSSGSPADVQIIQPVLRRLGTDPFTVDLATFLSTRLKQAFPEMATEEGDALTDLLIKPSVLLMDPFVREIFRIRNSQSFRDPTTLTTDEADALGANLFSTRELGDFARGVGRVYFAQPRNVSVTPANFFTSKGGLHFFPDGKQDITVDEMMLNIDGSLYYFDINAIAEQPGTAYNIGPNELANIANLEGTAKVINQRRFSSGNSAETAVDFVDRTQQELTERSMVTLRGIGARIPRAFPDVTRLAVVGFGDPEMQRDVLTGGGLGAPIAGGILGTTVLDGVGNPTTRRFSVADAGVDFTALVDAADPSSFVLTVMLAYAGPPLIRDLPISRVLDAQTVEVRDAVFLPFYSGRPWMLRKSELTLSGIPGGLLFPDTANGTVAIPNGEVHVGGLFDVSVRGSSFDSSTLVLDSITDASPATSGIDLVFTSADTVRLNDLTLGNAFGDNYAVGDDIYNALVNAQQFGYTLQILDGIAAGDYRVTQVTQVLSSHPLLQIFPAPVVTPSTSARWRLVDVIDIDLLEPKDTRVSGSDLQSLQNSDVVTTASAVDLIALGVSVNDVLRILEGPDASDYIVKALPSFASVKLDRALKNTNAGLTYTIFRANAAGGIQLPLIRVSQIELLDTAGQPVGSVIPYAKAVDIQSRAFENPGRGVKFETTFAQLGIITIAEPPGGFLIGDHLLFIALPSTSSAVIVPFPTGVYSSPLSASQVVSAINAAAATAVGSNTVLAVLLQNQGHTYIGIVPIDPLLNVNGGDAVPVLFGGTGVFTAGDIRVAGDADWTALLPTISTDNLDVVQVTDGNQAGFYGNLSVSLPDVLVAVGKGFAPEFNRHIRVGARSLGEARCYFMAPTSVEFGPNSVFTAVTATGATIRFFPDPTLDYTKVPAYPAVSFPDDGAVTSSGTTFTASYSFSTESVVPGDVLDLLFVPIIGSGTLPTTISNLVGKTLLVSVDGEPDQTITFGHGTAPGSADVLRSEVAGQINTAIGKVLASVSSSNRLEFVGDVSIVVRGSGTANVSLGLGVSDLSNDSLNNVSGGRKIVVVNNGSVTVSVPFTATESRVKWRIRRLSTQRCSSTRMNTNTAPAGLYYFDVELVSEGTGDIYNIDSDLQMRAEGYRSDGYYLTTDDSNLTFSTVERPRLHVSRSILEVGVSDSPSNATQLSGQNLEVAYDRSTLTSDVQNFVLAETERVVCSNPLSRHLVPHFVRFDFEYVGGSSADVVSSDISTYVQQLFPSDFLKSSDLVNKAYQRGATSVMSPIDLIALVYNYDRSIWAQRSQNALNTGRLAAFVVDIINVNRRSG
jgi:hypothetical protein